MINIILLLIIIALVYVVYLQYEIITKAYQDLENYKRQYLKLAKRNIDLLKEGVSDDKRHDM